MHRETSVHQGGPWWKKAVESIRGNRKLELAVYGGIALIVIVLDAAGSFSEKQKDTAAVSRQISVDSGGVMRQDTEARLKQVLSCIRGAGKVEVMITYETDGEVVTAMSTSTDTTGQESVSEGQQSSSSSVTENQQPATVNVNGSEEPIVLMERTPRVRGVIVVAEGAADIRVMLDLQRAVKAVLDIPVACIEVFEYGLTGAAAAGG